MFKDARLLRYPVTVGKDSQSEIFIAAHFPNLAVSLPQYQFASHRSTRALRDRLLGRWIKVRGWMLFDVEHQNASENTAPGHERNWRATAWEIHPITSIEVVQRPAR